MLDLLDHKDVLYIVHRNYVQLYGEYKLANANLTLIHYNEGKGILRTTNKALDETKSVLALIRTYNGQPLRFKTLGVSGTIKKCMKKYITDQCQSDKNKSS